MVEALKRNKKILIITGCIIMIPVLIIIFLAIFQGCSNSKITYDEYEKKMILAAEEYFKNAGSLPEKESTKETVELSALVKKGYIKSSEELLGDDSCNGKVAVRKNGSTIKENNGGYLNYIVSLECKEYKTKTLKEALMGDLTTSGSGLYKDNEYYVYKGDQVNNHIKFFGNNYRIINISEDGIAKLLKIESETLDRYWDNKYNVEINDLYGKNIYADSALLKAMISDYNNSKIIKDDAKRHMVSTDVCIDARDINNSVIGDYSCVNKLENQVVSLIGIFDFAKASLDPDCNSIYSKACGNYNYLKYLNLQTWTPIAVSNNTYQVYYLTNGIIKFQEASVYQNYNLVIHIDSEEKIVSGEGTEEEPYVIE